MAESDSKVLNGLGLAQVWTQVIALLGQKYGQSEVQNAINTALNNYYTKSETLSAEQINTLINNLNAIKMLNKSSVDGGVVSSTIAEVDTTCDAYVQTNYSREPQDFDGILVTLTDGNNDIVMYVYSSAAQSWVDASRNISISIATATDSVAGIAKLYNAIGTQTDGGITPSAVRAKTDLLDSSIADLQTEKADASALSTLQGTVSSLSSEVGNKAAKATSLSGYGITDAYTKSEVDGKIPGVLTTEEIAQIIGAAG